MSKERATLSHKEACLLSQRFNGVRVQMTDGEEFRINQFLKDVIAATENMASGLVRDRAVGFCALCRECGGCTKGHFHCRKCKCGDAPAMPDSTRKGRV